MESLEDSGDQALGKSNFSEEVKMGSRLNWVRGMGGEEADRVGLYCRQLFQKGSLHVKGSRKMEGEIDRHVRGWRRLYSYWRAAVLNAFQWERR